MCEYWQLMCEVLKFVADFMVKIVGHLVPFIQYQLSHEQQLCFAKYNSPL